MNTLKFALLGTAAIAAVSVSAQASTASDVAALKAQINALSAQVAAAQTTADLPAGYQFISTSMQPSLSDPTRKAYTIAIMPTADAPASTVFQWTGYVRAAFVYSQTDYSNARDLGIAVPPAIVAAKNTGAKTHILGRGQLNVVGKTDTAVGEVKVDVGLRANWDGNSGGIAGSSDGAVSMTEAKGTWAMTSNLALIAGYTGMVGGTGGYGTDKLNAFYSGGALGNYGGLGDTTQFDLAYADGPISLKVGVGHYEGTYNNYGPGGVGANDMLDAVLAANAVTYSDYAFGGKAEYKGDALSAMVAGYIHGGDYQIGVGATATMDMFTLSAAADIGRDANHTFTTIDNLGKNRSEVEDANYWDASLFAGASLSDSVKAELGVGYSNEQGIANAATPLVTANATILAVAGGIYYSPVSQLTIGAEGAWKKSTMSSTFGGGANLESNTVTADLVTIFSF